MTNSRWTRRWIVCCAVAGLVAAPCCSDGETRSTLAGQTVAAKENETCGTIRGISCEEGLWCDLRAGACTGRDLDGVCVRVPEVCAQNYDPVCGCDGTTYSNDCMRIAAKAQKDHAGECRLDAGEGGS